LDNFFIYGAYGYTGRLITEHAVKQGLNPILGGRDAEKTKALAKQHELNFEVLDANDAEKWNDVLSKISLVCIT